MPPPGGPIDQPLVHRDWVSSVAYSPDGRTILTGCYDRTARLWDRATAGRSAGRLRHQHCVRAVAFGPDGKTVLTGSFDGIARLWDIEKDRPIGPPMRHQHTVSAVAFSPDGRDHPDRGLRQDGARARGRQDVRPCRSRTRASSDRFSSVRTGKPSSRPARTRRPRLWKAATRRGRRVLPSATGPRSRRSPSAPTGKPF